MINKEYAYPCVYYYLPDRQKGNEYKIYGVFPDLHAPGIPGCTFVSSQENAYEAAKETLINALITVIEAGIGFPNATKSLKDVPVNVDVDMGQEEPVFIKFGFVTVYLSIGNRNGTESYKQETVEGDRSKEGNKTTNERFAKQKERAGSGQTILSGKIEGNRYIITAFAGKQIKETTFTPTKMRELYHVIGSRGESITLSFGLKKFELDSKQSIQLRKELEVLIQEMIRKQREEGLSARK
ncbi:hypothetical protein [Pseudalkalibacillus caeni]|uniref:Uncharacterized protein n=1 Tax=Exobacillus caeni TaxID=2574798 RepID=A0A5R9F5Z5_9BACL|nr:hypothetical protein [Pseudalkalibacillus caeni]TLS36243.1 hypothetical protein FCL54_16550 [Pseudalkalibacillus caeni]